MPDQPAGDDKPSLHRLQSWMQAVVTHPAGVGRALADDATRKQVDITADQVETAVTRSNQLTALERLDIYNRSYHARLLDCFRAEYPCLLHACGEQLFTHFVADYLHHHPPASYTLNRLSERFPNHLATTRPRAEAGEDEESWPDFLIDLATLERTFADVYDGPGEEENPPLAADQINALSAEKLAEARLTPAASLRLLAYRFPVADYFTAVRAGQDPALPTASPGHLALHRTNWRVRMLPLSPEGYHFLQALSEGETVAAASRAARQAGANAEFTPNLAKASLLTLAQRGMFRELTLP